MILEQSFRFEEELEHIIDFIALDSVAKALDFYDELINNIQNIQRFEYFDIRILSLFLLKSNTIVKIYCIW